MLRTLGDWLFDPSGLTAHGFCLLWEPWLIWTYALSDIVIAVAYFSIPLALISLVRKRKDLVFRPLVWLFAAFILLCGATHWLDLLTLWVPAYNLQGLIKAATAIVSIVAAASLWFLMPEVLALPSPAQMRAANAALLASQEQLAQAQKMEAVGQLTGGIAHDFNNLLQAIVGSLSLLQRRIEQGRVEDTARFITAIRQASDKATSLIDRLLAFSRRQTLQPKILDPDRLVRSLEDLIRRTLGPEIDLALQLNGKCLDVKCDPNQLESALLNLAINASDAMPDGGKLTIATSDCALSKQDLPDAELAPGAFLKIEVRDTGVGIAPDTLSRVLEPFFTTKPAGRGTGLGLSQAYGFVRQSGGFVAIESVLGEGTIVRLFLPGHAKVARTTEDDESEPAASRSKSEAHKLVATVLLVEDQDAVREQFTDQLTEIGCTVLSAEDGPAGLAIVQSGQPFDLLVTDVGLPGLNGRQLAQAARSRNPQLPVLLVTGYSGTVLEANLPPGIEVLRKPFPGSTLQVRVRQMLARTSPAQS